MTPTLKLPNVTRLPRPGRRLVAVIAVRKIEREGGSEALRLEMKYPRREGAEVIRLPGARGEGVAKAGGPGDDTRGWP